MDQFIKDYEVKINEAGCAPGSGRYGVQVNIQEDISPVFPYVNALLSESQYDHENRILIWRAEQQNFALRPHEIQIMQTEGIEGSDQAHGLAGEIVARLNKIWNDRERITPCVTEKRRLPVIEIFKLLPRTNCRQCGYPTCLSYAADLRDDKVKLDRCAPILKPEYAEKKQQLVSLIFPV